MTFEEKRKLSVFVGALDGDKLDRVIEIITQEQPELPGKAFCTLVFWSFVLIKPDCTLHPNLKEQQSSHCRGMSDTKLMPVTLKRPFASPALF